MKDNQKITIIWNKHGEGTLIGAFNNLDLIKEIKDHVLQEKLDSYIKFYEININEINLRDINQYLKKPITSQFTTK